jgi:hypothetical protein
MRRRSAWGSLLGVLVAATACGEHAVDDASVPEGNGASDEDSARDVLDGLVELGPVCTDCEPQLGGETSDFDGEGGECALFLLEEPVTREQAAERGFDVAALEQLVERDFEASFAWRPDDDALLGADAYDPGEPSSGHSSLSTIRGSVRMTGELVHWHLDPSRCDVTGMCDLNGSRIGCYGDDPRGRLHVGLDLNFATDDQSLHVATPARTIFHDPWRASTWLELDLASIDGKLRLTPTRPGPYRGVLSMQLVFQAGGVRGSLVPTIFPATWSSSMSWRHQPLEGRFPAEDECALEAVPIEEGSPESAYAQRVLEASNPRIVTAARSIPVLSTRWEGPGVVHDATGNGISLEVTLPSELTAKCWNAPGVVSGDASARFATSDGQLDWTTPVKFTLRDEALPDFSLQARRDVPADDAFWAESLPSARLWGAPMARVYLSAGYYQPNEFTTQAVANLSVQAVPACEQDPRCEDAASCTSCGRPMQVLSFDAKPPIDPPSP